MFISQQLVHDQGQLEIRCRVCEPELRRLELEVNEMKLTNTYLKERLRTWALQCEGNAGADVGHNLLGPGNAAHVSRCSLQSDLNRDGKPVASSKARSKHKVAVPQHSFTETTTPKLQSNYNAMNSSQALDLQKQLTEMTQQYRSLAQKYNEMVGRLQDCHNALHCSSKQTLELEQSNMELLQLKEMIKAGESCNEENTMQNLAAFFTTPPRASTAARWEGINQLSSPSMSTTTGKIGQVDCEVYSSKPHAACGQTITTMPNAKLDGVPPDYVPAYDQPLIMPTPYVIMPNGVVVPCNLLGGSYDGVLPPRCGTASETLADVFPHKSAGSQATSELWPKNVMLVERAPKKQQPSKEWVTAAIASPPADHHSLTNRNFTSNDFPGANNATSGQAFPDIGMSSPITCRHGAPNSINVPKIISIRANGPCHGHHSATTANGTSVLSPVDHNKPGRHERRYTPPVIRIDVQKEVKKVAVADNVECMAFPQGMYKTEMCNKWVMNKGECPYGKRCQFAHGSHELRPVLRHPSYKTMLCRMVAAGEPCPYEHRCHFRHVLNPKEALNRDLFIMNLHAA